MRRGIPEWWEIDVNKQVDDSSRHGAGGALCSVLRKAEQSDRNRESFFEMAVEVNQMTVFLDCRAMDKLCNLFNV